MFFVVGMVLGRYWPVIKSYMLKMEEEELKEPKAEGARYAKKLGWSLVNSALSNSTACDISFRGGIRARKKCQYQGSLLVQIGTFNTKQSILSGHIPSH